MTDVLAPVMSRFTNYAMTDDGLPEINTLTYLSFERQYSNPPAAGRFFLVLVEPRLLETSGDVSLCSDLLRRLQRLKKELISGALMVTGCCVYAIGTALGFFH